MKIKPFQYFSLLLLLITVSPLQAQEHAGAGEGPTHHFYHHRVAIFAGYGFITGAVDADGNKQLNIIPVLGIDYEYFFNNLFGIGLFNDFELSSYKVEFEGSDVLARDYAFVTAVVFLYEPVLGVTVFAGPGYEFEANHGFPLIKFGVELAKTFPDGWSVGVATSFDVKEVNSSLGIGLTVVKGIGKK